MPVKNPDYKVKTQTLAAALTDKPMLVNARMILFSKIPSDCTVKIGSVNADALALEQGTQKKMTLCGPKDDRIQYIYISCAIASGLLEVYTSEELDVDFSSAGATGSELEIVLATIVPRAIGAGLRTSDPYRDNPDPLSSHTSGDGVTDTLLHAAGNLFGVRYQIPAGATVFSHAGASLTNFGFPLAQILNTQTLTNHRGRNWYVEFADTIYTTYAGTNIIRRGFGFGEINETVGGWQKPFIGLFCDRGSTSWSLRARDNVSQKLSVPLPGYTPEEIHAVRVRIGQSDGIPYVEAWFNGFLAHRETMPLGADLAQMGTWSMIPWAGCARSLAADAVEMWGLLDGAMTLKLVYPDG